MGRKMWQNKVMTVTTPRTVHTLYPSLMGAKVVINPFAVYHRNVLGHSGFTDEELEIASRFNVRKEIEDALCERSRANL